MEGKKDEACFGPLTINTIKCLVAGLSMEKIQFYVFALETSRHENISFKNSQ